MCLGLGLALANPIDIDEIANPNDNIYILCGVSSLEAGDFWVIAKEISPNQGPYAEKTSKNSVCPPLRWGLKRPPTIFLAGIDFVGFLNLMQEIFDSMQKESACFDLPILRKRPKTVSVPPLVGAEKAPHNFFGWDSLCGVSKHDARDFWLNAKGISLFRPPKVE